MNVKNTYAGTAGGNEERADGSKTYYGYTLEEALRVAVECGSDEAWAWLQDWHNALLDDEDYLPGWL